MTEPTDSAVDAAYDLLVEDDDYPRFKTDHELVTELLNAAHDPKLGLDQSIPLRAIIEAVDSIDCGLQLGSYEVTRKVSKFLINKFT